MQPRTPVIVGAFLAALIAGLVARFLLVNTGAPIAVKEHFAQRSVGMPVDFSAPAQPFDGTSPILGSDPKPVPQRPYEKADDTQIQFLATNKTGADCCPSVFSTDTGCLCLTDDQKALMATRGGNRAQGNLA
jgi:hypothetical protein